MDDGRGNEEVVNDRCHDVERPKVAGQRPSADRFPVVKRRYARPSRARRQPRCRDIGRDFPAWYDLAAAERPSDF